MPVDLVDGPGNARGLLELFDSTLLVTLELRCQRGTSGDEVIERAPVEIVDFRLE
jgi:hypothetical protein